MLSQRLKAALQATASLGESLPLLYGFLLYVSRKYNKPDVLLYAAADSIYGRVSIPTRDFQNLRNAEHALRKISGGRRSIRKDYGNQPYGWRTADEIFHSKLKPLIRNLAARALREAEGNEFPSRDLLRVLCLAILADGDRTMDEQERRIDLMVEMARRGGINLDRTFHNAADVYYSTGFNKS